MRRRFIYLSLFFLSLPIFPWLVMGRWGHWLENPGLRGLVFIGILTSGAWLLRQLFPQRGWPEIMVFSALVYAAVYRLALFVPEISSYPLSLGWSEISRYYNASLFFAPGIYGKAAALPALHPSRYLLQSVPFLFDLPLWAHRLWQVFLWLAATLVTSWLLARRFGQPGRRLGLVLWGFLFLFQGPVYYHLLVMAILVLWGYDTRRPVKTWLVVLLASLWAGISRVNWFPAPGMLAAALYFIDTPLAGRRLWRYLLLPVAWTLVGSAAALGAEKMYQALSGVPAEQFGSSFSSDLLWYRLLPNATYPLGVLPSALLVSLPLGLGLLAFALRDRKHVHPIRLLGLAGILFVLFAGGIVVSVKIGGGSNLHNLDVYLSLLMVIGAAAALGRVREDAPPAREALPWGILALAAILPAALAVSTGGKLAAPDFAAAQVGLETVRQAAGEAAAQGGEVLFISQRHLLTFGWVENVPLVADYEQVFLMEMLMANNQPYLSAFHADLQRQRFALIVSDPLSIQYQGRTHQFGEENDAWVERVSEPVLACYEPLVTADEVGVQLLVPRPQGCE